MSFFGRLGDWGPFRVIGGSIRYKLIVALLLVALVPLATVGVAALPGFCKYFLSLLNLINFSQGDVQ